MTSTHKKASALLCAVIIALFALTGCRNSVADKLTIYETETLKIEREGAKTTVYDVTGGASYVFTTTRTRTPKGSAAQISEATTTTDTETITLQTVYNMIIITDKTTGETLYIR